MGLKQRSSIVLIGLLKAVEGVAIFRAHLRCNIPERRCTGRW